jgi:hypothetical protein
MTLPSNGKAMDRVLDPLATIAFMSPTERSPARFRSKDQE